MNFGMKSSKLHRFLGLRPRLRWGSLQRSPRPPSCEGLLAFGNRSFAPSALRPLLAPKHKILEPPLNKQLQIKVQLDCRPVLLDCLHNYNNYSCSNLEKNGKF